MDMDQLSDEEIFLGRLTLKEVKKRLISASPLPTHNHHRKTVGYINIDCSDDADCSLKIIETHSAPDICVKSDLKTITKSESTTGLSPTAPFQDWEIKPNDSFLKLEQMISKMSMTPDKQCGLENVEKKKINSPLEKREYGVYTQSTCEVESNFEDEPCQNLKHLKSKLPVATSTEQFGTPSSELKKRTPIFKTPGNPPSHKKLLGTPRRYQNVVSPVATYIRNCPQVPLIKDVCPKKPLPGTSSIPKPLNLVSQLNKGNVKQDKLKSGNQENMKLPAVAYRNAKETKVIELPLEGKTPQSRWAKYVASSIPRAMVVKHNHRETNSGRKPLQLFRQENSFGDLSLHQADLSVCTQKSSFSKPNKNI